MTKSKGFGWILWLVLLNMVLLALGCWGAFKAIAVSIDEPPELTAEYHSGEALLVMEDLAGEIIAEVAAATGSSPFVHRSWETATCTSGWDGRILWDGYVSAYVSYEFAWAPDEDDSNVDYVETIADAVESLGMEPDVESEGQKTTVRAERDDGLKIAFRSGSGLFINTGCVVEGGPYVYTPPHGNVSPANDSIRIAEQ